MRKTVKSPLCLRSFRIVAPPALAEKVKALLHAEGYRFEEEPFSPFCQRLTCEPQSAGSSLAAFFGYIYLQDRSSMLPPLALSPAHGAPVLDICASPGSKSGFLAQLVGPDGFVVANEPSHLRLGTLRANLHAANLPQCATSSYPGQELPLRPGSWPFILLDPPCSGWGTANKNPSALRIWRGEKLDKLVSLQKALIKQAVNLLAPGGILCYSTCTTNPEENQAQSRFAVQELGLERKSIKPFPGFIYDESLLDEGELLVDGAASSAQGFYISLLTKRGKVAETGSSEVFPEKPLPEFQCPTFAPSGLPSGSIKNFGGKWRFIPMLAQKLMPSKLVWNGFLLGTGKPPSKNNGDATFIPHPRLRIALPDIDRLPCIVMNEVGEIRSLLSGASCKTDLKTRNAVLCWRDLPLGQVSIKNGRIIASYR